MLSSRFIYRLSIDMKTLLLHCPCTGPECRQGLRLDLKASSSAAVIQPAAVGLMLLLPRLRVHLVMPRTVRKPLAMSAGAAVEKASFRARVFKIASESHASCSSRL